MAANAAKFPDLDMVRNGPTVGQEYILGLFINKHEYLYVSTRRLREACVVGNVWQCRRQRKAGSLHVNKQIRVFKVTLPLFLLSGPTRDDNSVDVGVKPNQISPPLLIGIQDEGIHPSQSQYKANKQNPFSS